MEYVEGHNITDIEALNAKFGKMHRVTDLLVEIFSRMIFLHGHIHCDPHPGNILVRADAKGNPQIVLIDHGFYCTTNEVFRK